MTNDQQDIPNCRAELVCDHLHRAFDSREMSSLMRPLIRASQRDVSVELPLPMADGSLTVYRGFRVQHSRSRGPLLGAFGFTLAQASKKCQRSPR